MQKEKKRNSPSWPIQPTVNLTPGEVTDLVSSLNDLDMKIQHIKALIALRGYRIPMDPGV